MALALTRIWYQGWIESLYIEVGYHFKFQYWRWIPTPTEPTIYILFAATTVCALGIAWGPRWFKGWVYQLACWGFFIGFSWIELMDKAYYLNHYYLVSLLALLLALSPRSLSLAPHPDFNPPQAQHTQAYLLLIRCMLSLVYFYAGLAKLHPDWLIEAQPLKIWLQSKSHYPLLGSYFQKDLVVLAFAWCGILFDLLAGFAMLWTRTRRYYYPLIVLFHLMTAWLFPGIGLFPYMMIVLTWVYFDLNSQPACAPLPSLQSFARYYPIRFALLLCFFVFQVIFPLRPYYWGGDYLWHERGFRFGWRVMLMEKSGRIDYQVLDSQGKILWRPQLKDYLNPAQIKQLSFQSDMAIEMAHFLEEEYYQNRTPEQQSLQGSQRVQVQAKCYVSLNGRASNLYWDPSIALNLLSLDAILVPP